MTGIGSGSGAGAGAGGEIDSFALRAIGSLQRSHRRIGQRSQYRFKPERFDPYNYAPVADAYTADAAAAIFATC